jgi:hypothetical protein
VHVGLTFTNTTTTNSSFIQKNVSFWAIVLYTKDISVSMFLLIECISLGMSYLMSTFFPLPTWPRQIRYLSRSLLYFQLTKLWILHMLRLCLLIMVQVLDAELTSNFLYWRHIMHHRCTSIMCMGWPRGPCPCMACPRTSRARPRLVSLHARPRLALLCLLCSYRGGFGSCTWHACACSAGVQRSSTFA